ncbi:MAG TPA: Mrp/NBP35 family ATP-binding protein [Anaerolineae bacterium]|nr:Mrp/NBP35 family ATP-binding protein [Anaerolineae bacterium]
MASLKDEIWKTLRTIPFPGYNRDIVSFGLVQAVTEQEGGIATIVLDVAQLEPEQQEKVLATMQDALSGVSGLRGVHVEAGKVLDARARVQHRAGAGSRGAGEPGVGEPASPGPDPRTFHAAGGPTAAPAEGHPQRGQERPPGVRYVIAVGSGKGGVGKSTVAANLAVALAEQGVRVGLMDADAYGPNVPRMMGVEALPPAANGKLQPAEAHGVRLVSIGFLVSPEKPLVWRGPMTDKMVGQFLADVAWGDLDLLIVDLPPSTGDIPLSLVKHSWVDGAIVVVTPQDVAVDDARKALGMFQGLNVRVLGVLENMSYFVCDECQARHALFGEGGGRRLAETAGVPFLGEIPLETLVRQAGDEGRPAVLDPQSQAGAAFRAVAKAIWRRLLLAPAQQQAD